MYCSSLSPPEWQQFQHLTPGFIHLLTNGFFGRICHTIQIGPSQVTSKSWRLIRWRRWLQWLRTYQRHLLAIACCLWWRRVLIQCGRIRGTVMAVVSRLRATTRVLLMHGRTCLMRLLAIVWQRTTIFTIILQALRFRRRSHFVLLRFGWVAVRIRTRRRLRS